MFINKNKTATIKGRN